MRSSFAGTRALLAVLLPAAAWAQTAAGTPQAEGYCAYTRGVADAQAAPLLGGELFVSAGAVNAGEASGSGVPLGSPTLRLTAGLGYSFNDLYQGLQLRRRAEADCLRYRAEEAVESQLQARDRIGLEPALRARAEALARAQPTVDALLAEARRQLANGQRTADELSALQLRADDLRALASQTAAELARLQTLPPAPSEPLARELEAHRRADAALEEAEAALRRAEAWDVRVQGGLDEVHDVAQEVPLFGQVTFSYRPGGLWVGGANARAREGRERAVREGARGLHQRVNQLVQELGAQRAVELRRLTDVQLLRRDVEAQLAQVEAVGSAQVRRFRDLLVLERARLGAEDAFLSARVQALQAYATEAQP